MTISQYRGEGAVNQINLYYLHLAYAWWEATNKGYEPVLEVQWEWSSSDSNQEDNIAIVVCEGFQSASCANLWRNTATMEFIAELPVKQEDAQDMVYIDMSKYANKKDYSVALDEYESYGAWDAMYTAHPSSVNISDNLDTEKMLNNSTPAEPTVQPVRMSLDIQCPWGTVPSNAKYSVRVDDKEHTVYTLFNYFGLGIAVVDINYSFTWANVFPLENDSRELCFVLSNVYIECRGDSTSSFYPRVLLSELLSPEGAQFFADDMRIRLGAKEHDIIGALEAFKTLVQTLKSRLEARFPDISLQGSIEL